MTVIVYGSICQMVSTPCRVLPALMALHEVCFDTCKYNPIANEKNDCFSKKKKNRVI